MENHDYSTKVIGMAEYRANENNTAVMEFTMTGIVEDAESPADAFGMAVERVNFLFAPKKKQGVEIHLKEVWIKCISN